MKHRFIKANLCITDESYIDNEFLIGCNTNSTRIFHPENENVAKNKEFYKDYDLMTETPIKH